MQKLTEHTYGNHIYMKIQLDDKRIEEIDVFFTNDGGTIFRTSADHGAELDKTESQKEERAARRLEIINAFTELY